MKPSNIILDRLNPKHKKYISKSFLRDLDKEVYNNTKSADIDFNDLNKQRNKSGVGLCIDFDFMCGKLPLKKR